MVEFFENVHFTANYWIVVLPVLLMGLDILTGLIYAWTSATFMSARMRTGLAKKFGELAYIVIGIAVTYAIGLPVYVLHGIAFYICFMELMSVLENTDKLGVPIPAFVRKVLNNVDESLRNEEDFHKVINNTTNNDAE